MEVNVPCISTEQRLVCSIIPPLSFSTHKGQAGRIAVYGGSREYTGAPYFSAISALKVGCDLAYVFCNEDSAPVIKSYSPELIVYPSLNANYATEDIKKHISKIHSVIIGPGLGRDEKIHGAIRRVIQEAKDIKIPIVIDADGLFFICSHFDVIKGYENAILTPNAMEFARLYKSVVGTELLKDQETDQVKYLCEKLGNVTIVRKGCEDTISNGINTITCKEKGSPRRCGGQGDLLSGSMGVFAYWSQLASKNKEFKCHNTSPMMIAALGACMLTRRCNRQAFQKFSRSTTTCDMINEIKTSFSTLFPVD
ncbi:ATP-dependent (S)-NAD(P)H-hydrate dehydratase-like [Centruroides sculpturatus]|uniref:ATP-dependent (S)-NAD(P)H-hydrate dehydratase-like n=1 Tax=Centruroides sculpturatus TaxID=218467 RepID=UPI000C6D679B|nr:ATP-dependent (S)-NAD(P)H-hydrate dehydratase-like [Centruroides sculpturatus]